MKHALVFVVAVAACSHNKSGPTTPPAASTVFELGEITVFDGMQPVMKLHADGSSELDGKPGPIAKADGTVMFGDKGIRVAADGSVTELGSGKSLPIVATPDRLTIAETNGVTITLAADGAVTIAGVEMPAGKQIRIDGASSPGKRRLVLTYLAFAIGGGSKHKDATTPESATATP